MFRVIRVLYSIKFYNIGHLFLYATTFNGRGKTRFSYFLVPLYIRLTVRFVRNFLGLHYNITNLVGLRCRFFGTDTKFRYSGDGI